MTDAEVHVLAPYRIDGTSEDYGTAAYRAEVAGWFQSLGMDFTWWEVHLGNIGQIIEALTERIQSRAGIAFNLCDGIETDGFPGLTVVRSLEARGIPFTGADSAFYAISTSKLEMKRRFARAAVPCAPGFLIADSQNPGNGFDIESLTVAVGFPCILKLDLASNGLGLTRNSVARTPEELLRRIELVNPDAGSGEEDLRRYGLFAEKYLAGREFTVLVVTDPDAPSGTHVYPAVEMRYNAATPEAERILFRGHRDAPSPYGAPGPHCTYVIAGNELQPQVMSLAQDAFHAVGGNGYARVDIRMDDDSGHLFVLEVNANCGLSIEEPTIILGVEAAGRTYAELIAEILRAGWHRHRCDQVHA